MFDIQISLNSNLTYPLQKLNGIFCRHGYPVT